MDAIAEFVTSERVTLKAARVVASVEKLLGRGPCVAAMSGAEVGTVLGGSFDPAAGSSTLHTEWVFGSAELGRAERCSISRLGCGGSWLYDGLGSGDVSNGDIGTLNCSRGIDSAKNRCFDCIDCVDSIDRIDDGRWLHWLFNSRLAHDIPSEIGSSAERVRLRKARALSESDNAIAAGTVRRSETGSNAGLRRPVGSATTSWDAATWSDAVGASATACTAATSDVARSGKESLVRLLGLRKRAAATRSWTSRILGKRRSTVTTGAGTSSGVHVGVAAIRVTRAATIGGTRRHLTVDTFSAVASDLWASVLLIRR